MAYKLTVSRGCLCDRAMPFISRWPNGDTSSPLPTVESLFTEARRAIESDAEEVTMEFDPRLRYPTRIRINDRRNVSDDEVEWVAQVRVVE